MGEDPGNNTSAPLKSAIIHLNYLSDEEAVKLLLCYCERIITHEELDLEQLIEEKSVIDCLKNHPLIYSLGGRPSDIVKLA